VAVVTEQGREVIDAGLGCSVLRRSVADVEADIVVAENAGHHEHDNAASARRSSFKTTARPPRQPPSESEPELSAVAQQNLHARQLAALQELEHGVAVG
jgi:hypothetical protein